MSKRKIFHQCVGSEREFTYNQTRRGKTYYVDVFVMDTNTNRTSAYDGAVVKIPDKKSVKIPSKATTQIHDGERKTFKLQKEVTPPVILFEAKERLRSLSFELQVCTGNVPFEIHYNGKLIHKSLATHWKRVRMKNVLPGRYMVKFSPLSKRTSFVTVSVTSKVSRLTLPSDLSIKIFDNLTTCNNVTVAWMGTDRKQKYCLYVKDVSEIVSLKRHKCAQMSTRSAKEVVKCMHYRNKDTSKAVMSAVVTGLKPSTQYVLDVYLSKGHSGPVAYKTVKISTKPAC